MTRIPKGVGRWKTPFNCDGFPTISGCFRVQQRILQGKIGMMISQMSRRLD